MVGLNTVGYGLTLWMTQRDNHQYRMALGFKMDNLIYDINEKFDRIGFNPVKLFGYPFIHSNHNSYMMDSVLMLLLFNIKEF